jgi:hypothetical protein
MAYADYLHCVECDCKVVYYVGDEDKKVLCLDCLKRKQDTIDQLMKTNVYLSKLLSKQSETFQNYTVPITPVKLPESRTEVWLDNKLYAIYTGQDAIDVEVGKITVPRGAILKIVDY